MEIKISDELKKQLEEIVSRKIGPDSPKDIEGAVNFILEKYIPKEIKHLESVERTVKNMKRSN